MDSVQHRHHLLTARFSCGPRSWMLLTNSCPFSANRKLHLYLKANKTKYFHLEENEKGETKLTRQLKITVAINNSLLTTEQVKCAVTMCCSFCLSLLHLFFCQREPKKLPHVKFKTSCRVCSFATFVTLFSFAMCKKSNTSCKEVSFSSSVMGPQ